MDEASIPRSADVKGSPVHIPVLIFDFDGTVAVGDGPVFAYAAAVGRAAGFDDAFVSEVRRRIEAGDFRDSIDGYDLVRAEAEARGASKESLDEGYRRSRAMLATAEAPVAAPPGLGDFLRGLDAERILLTNSPSVRLHDAITVLGLDGCFDRVIFSGNKPTGLGALLDELRADGAAHVLCVGDIWRNDLEPAYERGFDTALIGPWGPGDAPATFAAPTLVELLPELGAWAERAGRESAGRPA